MLYVRSILFTIIFFLTAPFCALFALLFCWLPYQKRYPFFIIWQRSMTWLAAKLCHIHYEVKGVENLPLQPYIVASNHQSTWETLAFFVIFPDICFVLKKELLQIPLFGWALNFLEPIAIDRSKQTAAREQVILQGKERLKRHRTVVIFPEGKRMPADQPGPFRSGAAALAKAAGVPLVPVSHNAGKYWPRRGWIKHPGTITVHIGKPIFPASSQTTDMHQQMVETITASSPNAEKNCRV